MGKETNKRVSSFWWLHGRHNLLVKGCPESIDKVEKKQIEEKQSQEGCVSYRKYSIIHVFIKTLKAN